VLTNDNGAIHAVLAYLPGRGVGNDGINVFSTAAMPTFLRAGIGASAGAASGASTPWSVTLALEGACDVVASPWID